MKVHDKLYINGAWTPSRSGASIEVRNAATEEVIARVPAGTPEDTDHAAHSARAAFGLWAATPVAQRAALLQGIAVPALFKDGVIQMLLSSFHVGII